MDFTHTGTQKTGNPKIDTQGPNFFSASILIIDFLEEPVKEFLIQNIFQQEGFTLACSQKETEPSSHAYRFSTITSFFRPQSHFPTPHNTKEACLYLRNEIATMSHLRAIITLGAVAHHSLLQAYQLPVAHLGCRPGKIRSLPDGLILAYTGHIPVAFLQEKIHLSARLQPLRHVLGLLKQKL